MQMAAFQDKASEGEPPRAGLLFDLGKGGFAQAKLLPAGTERRSKLKEARKNVLEAARLEPKDREMRAVLEDITQVIKKERSSNFLGGLYDDKEDAAAATAMQVQKQAEVARRMCERPDPDRCGKQFWVQQRAEWLGLPVEEVALEPASFEDQGTLYQQCVARAERTPVETDQREVDPGRTRAFSLDDLSSDEYGYLEDCMDAVERPFPQLKRQVSLTLAVHCAEELWAERD
mmetsp:Transcript_44514/g.81311  ORF Transcript_44514/g.81311 Transcript_44514/m.81311 type:complete len:232 (-) Transcript_44514:82-777(-)